jgi:hypothetical protein
VESFAGWWEWGRILLEGFELRAYGLGAGVVGKIWGFRELEKIILISKRDWNGFKVMIISD